VLGKFFNDLQAEAAALNRSITSAWCVSGGTGGALIDLACNDVDWTLQLVDVQF
jgi:hypothetical protein